MKSERRHELQHNELAQWLRDTYQSVQPYQNTVLGIVLLLAVALAVYTWWSGQSAAQAASAWDSFNTALAKGSPGELDALVNQYPHTPVANWSQVMAGDLYLLIGANQLFSNKANANESLSKAVENYQAVRAEAQTPLLRERATFGLARALESQNNLAEAEKYYREVLASWPSGACAGEATDRLADLRRPATKSFYDQFAKYDPKPAYTPETGGRTPPRFPEQLPDEPGTSNAPPAKSSSGPALKYHSPFEEPGKETTPKEAAAKEAPVGPVKAGSLPTPAVPEPSQVPIAPEKPAPKDSTPKGK
ncbi:MAG: hypothetical protein ABSG68_03320 [Thermoguttaceae bacterium]|jgi:tetratricopeptide (TPR) repeat protein